MSALVLGLGNSLMSDDGFGVQAVTALSAGCRCPETVRLLDGGTLGLDLLPHLEEIDHLLIIDALDMRAAPGDIFRLEGEEVPRAFASKLSVHQMGVQDLLAVAELRGHLPETVVVWGVQPQSVEMGMELTSSVAAALPQVVGNVLAELENWGYVCREL